ncbi:MAG: TIGR03560 family F420-dependent LLM class oxidoreductase [Dehalococcoidia bacterium]
MVDFGLQIEPAYGFTYEEVLELGLACSGHGFQSVWMSDHFMQDPNNAERNCMDCWTLMSALAAEVKDIRLGSLVTCVTYRNPAVLAKIAATVDLISGGRLDFGIGAGWNEAEHNAYGIRFPSPGERVDRLFEAIEIIRRLWTEPKATFQGKHYSVTDAVSAPKPVQRPYPPILVGGSKPRMLRAIARYADIVNMGSGQSPQSYAGNLGKLEAVCAEEGRDFNRIRKTHLMTFVVAKSADELEEVVGRAAAHAGVTPDQFRANRGFSFIGTAAEAVDVIKQYNDAGVSQFMARFPYGEERRSMRLFADDVMPRVR